MSIASLIATLLLPLAALLPAPDEINARRTETALLHREVSLRGVRVWDRKALRWSPRLPSRGAVLLVNLWDIDCPPCVAELPMLDKMAATFLRSEPDFKLAFIAETKDDRDLFQFLAQHKNLLAAGTELYQVTTEELRRGLGTAKRPITLLLDRHLIVRQAFVGSVVDRRSEVVESIERLLRAAKVED